MSDYSPCPHCALPLRPIYVERNGHTYGLLDCPCGLSDTWRV